MSNAVSTDEVLREVFLPFLGVLFGAITVLSDSIKWGAVFRLAGGHDAVYDGVLHIRFGVSGVLMDEDLAVRVDGDRWGGSP